MNPNYSNLARLLGADTWHIVTGVQILGLLPELLGGLRVTAALGLRIAVLTEYLATPSGLGRVMKFAISYSRAACVSHATQGHRLLMWFRFVPNY